MEGKTNGETENIRRKKKKNKRTGTDTQKRRALRTTQSEGGKEPLLVWCWKGNKTPPNKKGEKKKNIKNGNKNVA